MSPRVTVSAASPAASATLASAESNAVKSSLARARLTSVWIRQEIGAIDAYHGQRVLLLWQSKHDRRASSSVRGESQTTRRPAGGRAWFRPYGTSWIARKKRTGTPRPRSRLRERRTAGRPQAAIRAH